MNKNFSTLSYHPEQLDQQLHLVYPRQWIILVIIFILFTGLVLWGILGRVRTEITAVGILLPVNGLTRVEAISSGLISDIHQFNPGDKIQAGEVIAKIDQPLLRQQIIATQNYLQRLISAHSAHRETNRIEEIQYKLNLLQAEYQLFSLVKAGVSGEIISIAPGEGNYVHPGTLIYQLQSENSPLEAVLYLPPATHLEKIKPGLPVEIYLNIPPREELGFIKGVVTKVSQFPASDFTINQQLDNEALTKFFLKKGSPYIINVTLDNRKKNHLPLTNGMLCSARIIINQQSPLKWLFSPQKQYVENIQKN